ncbi:MAG: argininosuccinate lyase [Magnetococcales bacterium]|nr:argininosuccinate lyase [Magnetococcales bacterium]
MESIQNTKLWGARFEQETNQLVEQFTASIHYDVRLFRHDIRASIAHCRMLARQQIIPQADAECIVTGLEQIRQELERGQLPLQVRLEDIHMHVESRLHELIGPVAGKLHTARSRNDQVATDLRLYMRDEIDQLIELLNQCQLALLDLAEREVTTLLPGFTHLQIAQPVSLGHHLLAYVNMLARDQQRLHDAKGRLNQMPLGSAALAGTTFPVDRFWLAQELGFAAPCANSMDAVSDRDFVIETAAAAALIMTHLSRLSEELILWMSPPFAFIDLPDAFCTGSSIMPQKKNPDIPELIRGKSGRVTGHLVALLTLMKGLPLSYNRDMQEDKEAIFDTLDTVKGSLALYAAMIPGITVRSQRMAAMAGEGYATATDLADALVRQGTPFREAHEIVGRLVRSALEQQVTLDQLDIDEAIRPLLTTEASVNARDVYGGTALRQVREAIQTARKRCTGKEPA